MTKRTDRHFTLPLVQCFDLSGDDVWLVMISPDNSTVVTSKFGSISAWRLSTGQRLFFVEEHRVTAPICLLEKENTVLLATIINQNVKLYDLQTGHFIRDIYDSKLQKHNPMLSPLFMCSLEDHSVLYAGKDNLSPATSSRGWIRAVHLDTGEVAEKIQVNPNYMVHFIGVIEPDMLLLVMSQGAQDSRKGSAVQTKFFTMELWDISKNVLFRKLADLSDKVRCYALSSNKSKALSLGNSRFLASANVFRAEVKVFDLKSGDIIERMLTYPSTIHLMEFIDSNHVITASRDKIVRVWDLERNVASLGEESEEEAEVEIVDLYGYRAICWEKNGIRLVDLHAGHFIQFVNGIQPQMAFVNDSDVILASSGKLHLFDLNQRLRIRQFDGDVCQAGLTNTCFVYKQAQVIAVSCDQRSLCVFDISSGRRIAQLQCEHIRRSVKIFRLIKLCHLIGVTTN